MVAEKMRRITGMNSRRDSSSSRIARTSAVTSLEVLDADDFAAREASQIEIQWSTSEMGKRASALRPSALPVGVDQHQLPPRRRARGRIVRTWSAGVVDGHCACELSSIADWA